MVVMTYIVLGDLPTTVTNAVCNVVGIVREIAAVMRIAMVSWFAAYIRKGNQ